MQFCSDGRAIRLRSKQRATPHPALRATSPAELRKDPRSDFRCVKIASEAESVRPSTMLRMLPLPRFAGEDKPHRRPAQKSIIPAVLGRSSPSKSAMPHTSASARSGE